MEGLSSLKGLSGNKVTKRAAAVTNPLASLEGSENLTFTEKQHRVGARQRAFNFFAEAVLKGASEGWSVEELGEYVESCRDESKAPGTVRLSGKGKQTYYVGVSSKGNKILVQVLPGTTDSLKESFVSLYRYGKKNEALDYIQLGDVGNGVQVF